MEQNTLINEALSVSSEIVDAADNLEYELAQVKEQDFQNEPHRGIFLYHGEATKNIFGKDVTVSYYVYVIKNVDTAYNVFHQLEQYNRYDVDTNILTVTIFVYRGVVQQSFSSNNIRHELTHLYQCVKAKENNPNFKTITTKLYRRAMDIMLGDKKDQMDHDIAMLIYYSSPREQDAYINAHYADLQHARSPKFEFRKHKDELDYVFDHYEDLANGILCNQDDPVYIEHLQKFGIDFSTLERIVVRAMHRFERKRNHVEKLYQQHRLTERINPDKTNSIFVVNEQRLREIIREIIDEALRDLDESQK